MFACLKDFYLLSKFHMADYIQVISHYWELLFSMSFLPT